MPGQARLQKSESMAHRNESKEENRNVHATMPGVMKRLALRTQAMWLSTMFCTMIYTYYPQSYAQHINIMMHTRVIGVIVSDRRMHYSIIL